MTILLLRARGGESRFAKMLIRRGYFCAQYPQYIETPLPYGEHAVEQKVQDALQNPLVAADKGIPAIAISDSLAFDILLKVLRSIPCKVSLAALPFRLVLIGEKVIHHSAQLGIASDFTIPGMCDQALAAARPQLAPLDTLLLTSDKPPVGLTTQLKAICKQFNIAKVFARCKKMEPPPVSLAVTAVASCTSTALCRDTIARLDPAVLKRPFFAIGAKTAEAARQHGFTTITVAETDTLESLFDALAKYLGPPLLGRAL